ncbi:c-type cytochrome [Legionella impletisoli]|uniref:Cytochrome c n=1 Tax=Legionella impletisoli TaxID=343510 RepID=A0A917N7N5_9GAMM|nr:c-type cytochrome [Legionella impletisoli]GGI75510.1 cytochrome c [Legionella impletisoli]
MNNKLWSLEIYLKRITYGLILSLLSISEAWSISHHPQEFLRQIAGANDEGQQIVQHFCATCHAEKPQIPLGAPRIGYDEDWKPRIKEGIEALFKHTEEGFNAMPARGGCFECSDEQLLMAIIELLPNTEKNALKNNKKDHI